MKIPKKKKSNHHLVNVRLRYFQELENWVVTPVFPSAPNGSEVILDS